MNLNWLITNMPFSIRKIIYKHYGMSIGTESVIGCGFMTDEPSKVVIGDRCVINYNSRFYAGGGKIFIGNNCQLACNVSVICVSHKIGGADYRAGIRNDNSVHIGDGCWIGANVTILPGVSIGDGCVVAAGSVVAGDCEPDCLYAGVPSRMKKKLDSLENPRNIIKLC